MSIDFTHRTRISPKDGAVYLTLMAEDCAAENAMELLRELQHVARFVTQGNQRKLIIDVQRVGYIKSSIYSAFLASVKILRAYDRRFVLKNIDDHNWENIQRLHLDRFFDRDAPYEATYSNCLT